ncbi:MAG: hypothetical protein AAF756_16595 [Pseudomonadota bacterium]
MKANAKLTLCSTSGIRLLARARMKAVALVLVCLNISLVSSAAETLTSLGQLRWENRVLVILPPMAHKQE